MNPLVGLQTASPSTGMMSWQQGMPGLMGSSQPTQQTGLMGGGTLPSLQGVQPGDWSKVAYQMAGSPIQGPYPTAPALPMPAGVGGSSSSGSSAGGTALGLLGALAKNPSLLKSATNGISSLLGGGTAGLPADAAAGINSSALAGLDPVGVDSVSELPSVSSAVDAAGTDAAGSAAAGSAGTSAVSGGLMGGAASSVPLAAGAGTTSALGAGAPGVFASGDAAAGSGGAAAAGGSLAGAAAPLAVAGLVGLIGSGAISDKANDAGNTAMQDWLKVSGATFKPSYTNSGQNTFGTNNGLLGASTNPGTWYDKNGNVMTEKQVETQMVQWARANGIPTGNLNYTGG